MMDQVRQPVAVAASAITGQKPDQRLVKEFRAIIPGRGSVSHSGPPGTGKASARKASPGAPSSFPPKQEPSRRSSFHGLAVSSRTGAAIGNGNRKLAMYPGLAVTV